MANGLAGRRVVMAFDKFSGTAATSQLGDQVARVVHALNPAVKPETKAESPVSLEVAGLGLAATELTSSAALNSVGGTSPRYEAAAQALVVVPVDPAERRQLEVVDRAPGSTPGTAHQLGS